LQPILNKLFQ